MSTKFTGKCVSVGDKVTAYQISSNTRWKECGNNAETLGQWLFEPLFPEFTGIADGFKNLGYEIVVAGVDFGGGFKSNDYPVLTVKGGGIKLVICEQFNRIFFRNAINLGMPVLTCPGITKLAKTGDVLEVDIATGQVKNITIGETLQGQPLSDLALKLINSGGLLAYWKERLETDQ